MNLVQLQKCLENFKFKRQILLQKCFSVSNVPFTYFTFSVHPLKSDSNKIKN